MDGMLSSKIRISSEVLSQEVGGETVLLDLKGESYFGLDEIGTRIWQGLNDELDLPAIVEVLLAEFDVERDTLVADLERLIGELSESGLVAIDAT